MAVSVVRKCEAGIDSQGLATTRVSELQLINGALQSLTIRQVAVGSEGSDRSFSAMQMSATAPNCQTVTITHVTEDLEGHTLATYVEAQLVNGLLAQFRAAQMSEDRDGNVVVKAAAGVTAADGQVAQQIAETTISPNGTLVYKAIDACMAPRAGGMIDLFIRVMAVSMGQNQLRSQASEEDARLSRADIRTHAGSVVTAREKMAKTMTKFAMIGGMLTLFGAVLPKIPLGDALNKHRETAGEFFKTAGKGMESGNSISQMQTEAKIYNNTTDADLSKQNYEVNWTRQQEHRNSNRTIKDEMHQMMNQLFGWFNRLWSPNG